jgi:adenylate cyclase
MSKTDELLLDREVNGLRISFFLKILFFLAMLGGTFSPEATEFERIFGSIETISVIGIISFFLYLIRDRKHLALIGITSSFLDGIFLALIVIIWYVAEGGSSISPVLLLKTTIYTFSTGLMILNSFALRPLYPIIVGIVFTLAQIGFFIFAFSIQSDMNTTSFKDQFLSNRISFFLYFLVHILLPFIFGSLALAFLTHIARSTVLQAIALEKEKSQMQRYFSPKIAEKIIAEDEDFLKPGGSRHPVAIMFCDIRNFTRMSEKLKPEEVVEVLSRYHAQMVEVIFKHNGTLDKYIGDAIMATFGTPNPSPNDCDNALRAAIDMRLALHEWNEAQKLLGRTSLAHGISISYGDVIVGNIGTRERLEYTVIGDAVNTASRMESLCKEYNADILISESLKQQLKLKYNLTSLGLIPLRGKDEPISIFKVE